MKKWIKSLEDCYRPCVQQRKFDEAIKSRLETSYRNTNHKFYQDHFFTKNDLVLLNFEYSDEICYIEIHKDEFRTNDYKEIKIGFSWLDWSIEKNLKWFKEIEEWEVMAIEYDLL